MGFAQGKTMLVRRRDLAQAGGIHALAEEIAEDAAATKLVRRIGLRASLVDAPFVQPLGRRTAKQVWDRQTRWARLRRISFPGYFAAEILTGCLLPLAAAAYVADAVDMPAVSIGRGAGRSLVRQRGAAGARRRLAPEPRLPTGVGAA